MKKLFSLVLVVVLAATMVLGTAMADEVLLQGGNGTVDLTNVAEGDTLEVVVECTEASAATGWGIGGLCLDGSWSVAAGTEYECLLTADPVVGETLTFTYDASAVKAVATGDVNVNFYNGYTVVTVTLKSASAGGDAGTGDAGTGDAGTPDDSVQTGDMTNIAILAGVAALALVAVVASKKANA